MKFGELIDFNMGNIFLEKSYKKCDKGTNLRPFSEKLKKKHISLFLLYGKLSAIEIY